MFYEEIITFLTSKGLSALVSKGLAAFIIAASISLAVIVINFITRKIILSFFKRIAKSTASSFDDLLIKNKVPRLLSYTPSLFFLFWIIPSYFNAIYLLIEAFTVILFILTVRAILNTVKDYFKSSGSLKHIPVDSYIQVVMIFMWFVGIVLILSILTGREVGTFLASIGALSAIIILVFRDTILGFVSSIQITVNDTKVNPWNPIPDNSRSLGVQNINGIKIHPFILPQKLTFKDHSIFEKTGGIKGWNAQQGFYIYRNNRLMINGGWLKLKRMKLDEHCKLARIIIEFDSSLDLDWHVDVSKSKASIPSGTIRQHIEAIAKKTRKDAEEVLEKYHCKATELPLIFVNDPAIVGLGVKPGDMIKITRKSATAGESFYYRYVIEV